MAILKVARIGHPVVRQKAKSVDPAVIQTRDFQRFLDDMVETMHEYDGVGVAAPQVHVGLRVAVLEVPGRDGRGGRRGVPLTVLINPVVTPLAKKRLIDTEGCLSIPDLRGMVPRFEKIRLEALGRDGRPYTLTASGFHARVIQHECDHLDGQVYLDRMTDMKTLGFLDETQRFSEGAVPCP
ncbi:MAG: peptide deformylase [Vicinamibacteria bacterium]|nr:peptide deformylase [Vicinamibacteria bacterium]